MSDLVMPDMTSTNLRPMDHSPDPVAVADRVFKASEYDFGALDGNSALLLEQPRRRGVRIFAARTSSLPDDAVDAIMAWRLGQYLLTGFYDAGIVTDSGMMTEP